MRCSNCGNDNPAGSRFCNQCGLTLESTSTPGPQAELRPPSVTGERRHLTVLFCDLVNSTRIAAGVGKEADVFGDVPSIAARLQAIAEPGTVLITGDTHRLVSGLFEVRERGARALKGIEQAVTVFQVIQPSGARGRLGAALKF